MLSRTAENLYWTARYIERADSIARLLEVAYRIHLIPNTTEGYQNEWESILAAAGIKNNYLNTNNEITKNKIEYFLLFDPKFLLFLGWEPCFENGKGNSQGNLNSLENFQGLDTTKRSALEEFVGSVCHECLWLEFGAFGGAQTLEIF